MASNLGHDLDVPVGETWERLAKNPKAVLIDVRTRAEWAFVGMPDLSSITKRLVLVEWLTFPENRMNPEFVEQLSEQLKLIDADPDSELYFICRSGGRSLQAAETMMRIGFKNCFNVAEGFEGALDARKHRGSTGWKAAGLPWVQG